jgi:hypothetical protein
MGRRQGVAEAGPTLQAAAAAGDVELLKVLLARGADPDDVGNDVGGETALHAAATNGALAAAQMLLAAGADLRLRDIDGGTALHSAVLKGHCAVAELLLRHGAPLAEGDRNGDTPLHLAAKYGRVEAIAALLKGVGRQRRGGRAAIAGGGGQRDALAVCLARNARGKRPAELAVAGTPNGMAIAAIFSEFELKQELDSVQRKVRGEVAARAALEAQLAEALADFETLEVRLLSQEAGALGVQREVAALKRRLKGAVVEAGRKEADAAAARAEAAAMSDELAAAKRWRGNAAALVAEELAKQKPAAADPAPLHAALGRGAPPGGSDEAGRLVEGIRPATAASRASTGEDDVVGAAGRAQRQEARIRREAEVVMRRHVNLIYSLCPQHGAAFDGHQSPFLPPQLANFRCGCPASIHRMQPERAERRKTDSGPCQGCGPGEVDDIPRRRSVRELVEAERVRQGLVNELVPGARAWWCGCGRLENHAWDKTVLPKDMLGPIDEPGTAAAQPSACGGSGSGGRTSRSSSNSKRGASVAGYYKARPASASGRGTPFEKWGSGAGS